ncbi:MAG: hypothetical protein OXU35_02180, partial [Acidobacteriota bacterium]|nr:hypothetical protein [Acidobacteriota bacterium]
VHQLSGLANSATLAPLRVAADPECYPDAGPVSLRVAVPTSDIARPERLGAICKFAALIVAKVLLKSLQNSG